MTAGCQHIKEFSQFVWTDICEPDQSSLDAIARKYQLDDLQIKDSIEIGHLPKLERQSNYDFLILRAFTSTIEEGATTINDLSNKIAFFFNGTKVITIHRCRFEFLENLQREFQSSEELLLYIIRQMVETYQSPLNELGERIEELEKEVFLRHYEKVSLSDLYYLKTQTRITKKLLVMFQDVIGHLEITATNKSTFQDIKDRLISLILNYDEVLENANNLLNSYHSVNSQKSNDTMKMLTIFSAFFLPLTFIAGIYGMNFENMPELTWPMGYFITWGIMIGIAVLVFIWFKRKKIL
ncbi:MAG: CorA family divalent cation transporter [Bacteroidota bacterium]